MWQFSKWHRPPCPRGSFGLYYSSRRNSTQCVVPLLSIPSRTSWMMLLVQNGMNGNRKPPNLSCRWITICWSSLLVTLEELAHRGLIPPSVPGTLHSFTWSTDEELPSSCWNLRRMCDDLVWEIEGSSCLWSDQQPSVQSALWVEH